ncbi:hypothetical protein BX600DRAFT_490486 [Xylariales sp. PMI_506]|nr:hypothetical protein BX600DRAFT_490486 [Xylariales sp. PMI_506]
MPAKKKDQSPQEAIDEFWSKFTTTTPGKATSIIPQNEYAKRAATHSHQIIGITTQASYTEAVEICQAKVAKIANECRRVNQKYRDPHFDLEFDMKWGKRDTLESLSNRKETACSEFNPKSVKRVPEIFDNPRFYIDGPEANDVRQGRDGDCWLMAALCALSNKPGLIERCCVARDEQVGVYGFVFNRDGEWISEIIDDKLFLTKPDFEESFVERMLWEDRERVESDEQYRAAYQCGSGALYFAQCVHSDETWLPLLEKAYAKAHGDYAAIEGGFTGEGIEDLTGGKEELMKANQDFLFGCSTGMWGLGWGDRKGIVELHAYSIMKAIEINGQRLVLLKNPWGKGEWKGPWSDGSKEWTAEWLLKLNHRFGDDGVFWISYKDLLRKFQAFDRTRLFGPEWKVVSLWTTVSVPWAVDYQQTHFAFSLSRSGPLDDRYYRGLQAGQAGYVVRSISPYCQKRSVSVELELEEGAYTVLFKIMPIEEVMKRYVQDRRDKLVAIGIKAKVTETEEEKRAKVSTEKRKREELKCELKKKIMSARKTKHYFDVKQLKKRRARKIRAKQKAAAKMAKSGSSGGPETNSKLSKSMENVTAGNDAVDSPKSEVDPAQDSECVESSINSNRDSSVPDASDNQEESEYQRKNAPSEPRSNKELNGTAIERQDKAAILNDTKEVSDVREDSKGDPDSEESDISSVSEITDHELEIELDRQLLSTVQNAAKNTCSPTQEEKEEYEGNSWNAVVSVGLRVYHKVFEEDQDEEVVMLRLVQRNPYGTEYKDGTGKSSLHEADERNGALEVAGEAEKGLDVDDCLKDATLVGDQEQRRKSIAPSGQPGK